MVDNELFLDDGTRREVDLLRFWVDTLSLCLLSIVKPSGDKQAVARAKTEVANFTALIMRP
jgi:hypothetical protein